MLAYGIRAGLGTMTRALALYKEGKYQDMRGWRLVSERGLQYRCCPALAVLINKQKQEHHVMITLAKQRCLSFCSSTSPLT